MSVNGTKHLIMAVDDAPESLVLLERIVAADGHAFLGARSGSECLSLTLRFVPRLILLDIEMPEIDGIETCRRLRARRELAQVPIAFLTAHKGVEHVTEGIASGGNDFIVKPFDRRVLVERIRRWTARRVSP